MSQHFTLAKFRQKIWHLHFDVSRLIFDPKTPSIIVKAKIQSAKGIAYADLVFDTGASLVMLPYKLAIAVGLPIDPKRTIRTTTASSIETSSITTIPELNVLGQAVKNVDCIVRDLPKASFVDGLLGLNFIRHFNVLLDFKRGVLELTRH